MYIYINIHRKITWAPASFPLSLYKQISSKVREKEKAECLAIQVTEFIPTHYLEICGLYKMKDKLKMHTKNL